MKLLEEEARRYSMGRTYKSIAERCDSGYSSRTEITHDLLLIVPHLVSPEELPLFSN